MAKKNKNNGRQSGQPASEVQQVAEVAANDDGEAVVPEVSSTLTVEDASAPEAPAPVFTDVTPARPNQGKMSLREAVTRYVNDKRYKDSWNVAILKHAHAHGHKSECTAEEWIHIFRTYGLKVRE